MMPTYSLTHRFGTGLPDDSTAQRHPEQLSDTDKTVDGAINDIRGRKVKDKDGRDLGKVHDLLVDEDASKVRFLLIEHGGFLGVGETKSFIPVDAITRVTADEVVIDRDRDQIAAAPGYDPDLINDRT